MLVFLLFLVRLIDRLIDTAFGLITLAVRGMIALIFGIAGRAAADLRAARANRR
jgi:hypothetical protein